MSNRRTEAYNSEVRSGTHGGRGADDYRYRKGGSGQLGERAPVTIEDLRRLGLGEIDGGTGGSGGYGGKEGGLGGTGEGPQFTSNVNRHSPTATRNLPLVNGGQGGPGGGGRKGGDGGFGEAPHLTAEDANRFRINGGTGGNGGPGRRKSGVQGIGQKPNFPSNTQSQRRAETMGYHNLPVVYGGRGGPGGKSDQYGGGGGLGEGPQLAPEDAKAFREINGGWGGAGGEGGVEGGLGGRGQGPKISRSFWKK